MWADLGSQRQALLAMAPLAVGLVWMVGAMALLGVHVNFMNIFVMTMIIGIGVDYGIHLLHRWSEAGADPSALSETAKAIAVAALTSVAGFGSLVLSHFPGLRSVGVAAILGRCARRWRVSSPLLPVRAGAARRRAVLRRWMARRGPRPGPRIGNCAHRRDAGVWCGAAARFQSTSWRGAARTSGCRGRAPRRSSRRAPSSARTGRSVRSHSGWESAASATTCSSPASPEPGA
jgi:uncharacterized membrane protein YdfJ with MMPL/SSD domain